MNASNREPHKNQRGKGEEISREARRKQIILGVVMGIIVGVVISAITTFWYWLPAGIAFGLAVGAVMKPPSK